MRVTEDIMRRSGGGLLMMQTRSIPRDQEQRDRGEGDQ